MLEAEVGSVDGIQPPVIVTLNVQVEVPHEFVAVHVTTVVPAGNVLPDAGAQETVGDGVPVADGVAYVTTGLDVEISEGHEPITGDSLIVTENEQLDAPHEFVAVQVTVVVPALNVEPDAGVQITFGLGVPVAVGVVHVAT